MSDEAEILNEGRVKFQVQLRNQDTEEVTVKKVSYRKMREFAQSMLDDSKHVLLGIEEKKDLKWVESLDDESMLELIEKVDEVNDPLFMKWYRREERRNAMLQGNSMADAVSDAVSRSLSEAGLTPSKS